MSNAGLGVPVKLLHESLGHIITVELKTGQLYRGKLAEGELRVNDSLLWISLTRRLSFFDAFNSRRQSEHLFERNYGDRTRWPRFAAGPGLYSGKHGQIFHCPRYVAERTNASTHLNVFCVSPC
jgi:hypothetical protein